MKSLSNITYLYNGTQSIAYDISSLRPIIGFGWNRTDKYSSGKWKNNEGFLSAWTGSTRRRVQEDDSSNNSSTETSDDSGSNSRGLGGLVNLVPFDVRIALSNYDQEIQILDVSNIVTQWMNSEYVIRLSDYGYSPEQNYARFEAVVLLKRTDAGTENFGGRRQLSFNREYTKIDRSEDISHVPPNGVQHLRRSLSEDDNKESTSRGAVTHMFTGQFKGGAYFRRMDRYTRLVPEADVLAIQRMMFYNSTPSLLQLLQLSTAVGLGPTVLDVDALLNTDYTDLSPIATPLNEPTETTGSRNNNKNSDDTTNQLEIIIISAIAVAVLAFLFLLAAIYWAYHYDKKNREAYTSGNSSEKRTSANKKKSGDNTDAETASPKTSENVSPPKTILYQPRYPSYPVEIVGGSVIDNPVYPESVMSDSIMSDQRSILDDDVKSQMTGYASTEQVSRSIPPVDDDVSASLSQYYRSGMGKVAGPLATENIGNTSNLSSINGVGTYHGNVNDTASVSSMESYGYSLDGTIPSIKAPSYGGGTTSNNISIDSNKFSALANLERIGGLPVEPDLTQIEHLTIDDIVGLEDSVASSNRSNSITGNGTLDNDLCTIDGSLFTASNYLHS